MDKPTRLFDLLTYRKSTKPDRAVLVAKRDGEWKKIFIDEYIDNVDAVSCAFLHLGIKKGDNVALISSDRPEWNYVDLGVLLLSAFAVFTSAYVGKRDKIDRLDGALFLIIEIAYLVFLSVKL